MKNKTCPKCGQIKGLSEFNNNGYCKVCYRAYLKDWRENNKNYMKQWLEDNKGYYLYIICKNEEVQYVGATEVLSKRLNFHINCKSNIKNLMNSQDWTEIRCLDIIDIVANREEMLLLENVLIELYEPSYNKVMNRIKSVDKLRELSLLAEIHNLNQHWELYTKNKII